MNLPRILVIGANFAGLGAALRLAVAVGPEGGLSPAEIAAAQACGWEVVSLGPRILRAETLAAPRKDAARKGEGRQDLPAAPRED